MNATIFKHLNDCSQSRLQWKATLLFPHSINTDPVDLCEYLIPWSIDESKKQATCSYPKGTRYRFEICMQNRLSITDGDSNEYLAFSEVMKNGTFGNSVEEQMISVVPHTLIVFERYHDWYTQMALCKAT